MKRIICILLLLSCLGMTVNANPNMMGDVGEIAMNKATPIIDGSITDSEGWTEAVYAYKDIMATFGNTNDILQSFYLRYAYDDEYIYYCADILDSSFVYSTGEDDIDNVINDFNIKNENVYGYNGDIFTFTMDPLGQFLEYGFLENTDYNSWYSVGIFEGDICRMYRGHNRSGDITDSVKVAGHRTEGGWCFEAAIPWDFICVDADEMSFGDVMVTPEQMAANGADHRAMAIYLDRFIDPEAEEIATYQRFATCGYILPDGLLGYLSSGVCLKAYGIMLKTEGMTTDTEGDDTTGIDSDDTTVTDSLVTDGVDTTDTTALNTTETNEGADQDNSSDTAVITPNTTEENQADTTGSNEDQAAGTQNDDAITDKDQQTGSTDTALQNNNNESSDSDINSESSSNADADQPASDSEENESAGNQTGGKDSTKQQSTNSPNSISSTQTFDLGVGVAIGGLAIAIIGFIFVKKKL